MEGSGAKVVAQESGRRPVARLARNITAAIADLLEPEKPLCECAIIGDADAPFPTGHRLAHLKTEGADVAERADPFAVPCASMHVRAILHNCEPVTPGNRHDAVHVGHGVVSVHGNDGPGTTGDGAL